MKEKLPNIPPTDRHLIVSKLGSHSDRFQQNRRYQERSEGEYVARPSLVKPIVMIVLTDEQSMSADEFGQAFTNAVDSLLPSSTTTQRTTIHHVDIGTERFGLFRALSKFGKKSASADVASPSFSEVGQTHDFAATAVHDSLKQGVVVIQDLIKYDVQQANALQLYADDVLAPFPSSFYILEMREKDLDHTDTTQPLQFRVKEALTKRWNPNADPEIGGTWVQPLLGRICQSVVDFRTHNR